MKSIEKLNNKFNRNLHICVGLDTDINKIPKHLIKFDDPVFEFNKQVIESTKKDCAAYKLNLAFYEKDGINGLRTLEKTLSEIPSDVLTIGDAKRGDIGNTSKMYAESLFHHFGFDASTLHPYMGKDSVDPFLDYESKLNFILVLTSNQSNKDFEKLKLQNGKFLYQEVLNKVNDWNNKNNCGIVFGATNPQELKDNISSFNNLPILLPGVGSQGGSLEEVVEIFESADNKNYLINVSRALIYCDSTESYPEKIHYTLEEYNSIIQRIKNKLVS
jgi:orotidine-5'-phosphate decarboxylase